MASSRTQTTQVMSRSDVARAVTRIAHEIVERHSGLDGVVIVGLQRGGAWLAEDLRAALAVIDPTYATPVGMIDVSMHRDDVGLRPIVPGAISRIDARSTMPSSCSSTTSCSPDAPCVPHWRD